MTVTIRPFRPADQAAAKELILAGLEEHWGWRDARANPDLDDLGASYQEARFLVAVAGAELVGTGALIRRDAGTGEIVRMSVSARRRRSGIGSALLAALCQEARAMGLSRLLLETTAAWHEVIAFYERRGFRFTHERDGEAWFVLDLERSKDPPAARGG